MRLAPGWWQPLTKADMERKGTQREAHARFPVFRMAPIGTMTPMTPPPLPPLCPQLPRRVAPVLSLLCRLPASRPPGLPAPLVVFAAAMMPVMTVVTPSLPMTPGGPPPHTAPLVKMLPLGSAPDVVMTMTMLAPMMTTSCPPPP